MGKGKEEASIAGAPQMSLNRSCTHPLHSPAAWLGNAVIIQDHVRQPFEDMLPYERFSVRVPRRDLPDLIPLLR